MFRWTPMFLLFFAIVFSSFAHADAGMSLQCKSVMMEKPVADTTTPPEGDGGEGGGGPTTEAEPECD